MISRWARTVVKMWIAWIVTLTTRIQPVNPYLPFQAMPPPPLSPAQATTRRNIIFAFWVAYSV